jgi:hypothetical protein
MPNLKFDEILTKKIDVLLKKFKNYFFRRP